MEEFNSVGLQAYSLIFIAINHIMSLKQSHLFFVYLLEHLLVLDDNVDEDRK